MRGWDGSVRVHVGLVALNALALAGVSNGTMKGSAMIGAVATFLLLVLSFGGGCPKGVLRISGLPCRPGFMSIGRGFEWADGEAQETITTGGNVWRTERELFLSDAQLSQHLLILRSTGTGKTRLLELLALQAIARGDAVVIIDPKGDDGLLSRVKEAAGCRFRLFSLPHPEASVRYNPVGRYQDVREVADRIAALLPSTGDALPFRNFGWDIINTAARILHGKKPITLRALKRAAIDRPVGSLANRPRDHYLKMASALIPLLGKLGSRQLSPETGGLSWEEVDQSRLVTLMSLGALLGQESASAVARMAVLDLQSYVGARYAFGKGGGPMWLFVDELGDVATQEFIGLLNKSRGAGLRIVACAQTLSDLETALGNRASAERVIGNANTVVQFRAQSGLDAEQFSRMAGERLLRIRSDSVAYEPALLSSGFKSVDDFRARFGEASDSREKPLVPAWAVANLPILHFYARTDGRLLRGRVPVLA